MNFEAIKEKLRDLLNEAWSRIQETSIYMNVREKYDALSARAQMAIIVGALILAGLFLFSFPYSYISESKDNIASFEENRGLIRDLLKASRTLHEPSPLPPGISAEVLSSDIGRALDEFHLVPEQVAPAQPMGGKVTSLAPDAVKQVGVSLQLKKLNLKQIVEISHRLETLNPGVKMMGLDITENASLSHYFDVVYKLAGFSVEVPPPAPPERQGTPRRGSPPSKKAEDEE